MKSSVKRLLTHTITNNLAQQINCVEAVPVRWLTNEEKKCFWPQFKTKNLTKLTLAVKAAIQPTKEFSKYPVRVYKKYRKQFIKIKCTRIYISKYRSTFQGENTQLILIEVRKWCFCKIFDLCLILFLLLEWSMTQRGKILIKQRTPQTSKPRLKMKPMHLRRELRSK